MSSPEDNAGYHPAPLPIITAHREGQELHIIAPEQPNGRAWVKLRAEEEEHDDVHQLPLEVGGWDDTLGELCLYNANDADPDDDWWRNTMVIMGVRVDQQIRHGEQVMLRVWAAANAAHIVVDWADLVMEGDHDGADVVEINNNNINVNNNNYVVEQ